jgi:hypothetical protein
MKNRSDSDPDPHKIQVMNLSKVQNWIWIRNDIDGLNPQDGNV